jgi:hypothetical protein
MLKIAKRVLQAVEIPRERAVERFELLGQVYQKMAWMLRWCGKREGERRRES